MQYSLDLGLPAPEAAVSDTRSLLIKVDKLFSGDACDDEGVACFYGAEVPFELEDDMAAACALGAFHSTFVVNWVESFRFTVLDAETKRELQPDTGVDWVALGKSCIDIERLGVDG